MQRRLVCKIISCGILFVASACDRGSTIHHARSTDGATARASQSTTPPSDEESFTLKGAVTRGLPGVGRIGVIIGGGIGVGNGINTFPEKQYCAELRKGLSETAQRSGPGMTAECRDFCDAFAPVKDIDEKITDYLSYLKYLQGVDQYLVYYVKGILDGSAVDIQKGNPSLCALSLLDALRNIVRDRKRCEQGSSNSCLVCDQTARNVGDACNLAYAVSSCYTSNSPASPVLPPPIRAIVAGCSVGQGVQQLIMHETCEKSCKESIDAADPIDPDLCPGKPTVMSDCFTSDTDIANRCREVIDDSFGDLTGNQRASCQAYCFRNSHTDSSQCQPVERFGSCVSKFRENGREVCYDFCGAVRVRADGFPGFGGCDKTAKRCDCINGACGKQDEYQCRLDLQHVPSARCVPEVPCQ